MGLVLQPYWSPGLKMPGPEAKGAIIGFGDVHTRAHIYRSILEGLAFALLEGKERTEQRSGVKVTELRVSGGGSQSDGAMQLTADIFNLPDRRGPHVYETSGVGAAMDAAVGLRLHRDFDAAVKEMTRVSRVFEPNPPTGTCTTAVRAGLQAHVPAVAAAVRGNRADHRLPAQGVAGAPNASRPQRITPAHHGLAGASVARSGNCSKERQCRHWRSARAAAGRVGCACCLAAICRTARAGERRMPTLDPARLLLRARSRRLAVCPRSRNASNLGALPLLYRHRHDARLLRRPLHGPAHPLSKQHVLAGMAAFALGHVAYIVAGLRLARVLGPRPPPAPAHPLARLAV